jgi:transposase-like protein
MTDHLGYEKHDPAGHHRGSTGNGKSQKTLKGDFGEPELETPRDLKATFDPKIVGRGFFTTMSHEILEGRVTKVCRPRPRSTGSYLFCV